MTFPSLATSARELRGLSHVLVVGLLLTISAVVGVTSTSVFVSGVLVSSWWPAAGVNVIAMISTRQERRWLVAAVITAVTALTSLHAGRPVIVAVVGAGAVAAEAWIVARLSVDAEDQPRFTTTTDVLRFFAGTLIGAGAAGTLCGVTRALVLDTDPLTVGFTVFASHASAIAVLAPLALVNRFKHPPSRPAWRMLHPILLVAAVTVAFAPNGSPALAFLPVPFLAWAAFSFTMLYALVELIATSGAIVVLTVLGDGPFAVEAPGLLSSSSLFELYVVTLTVTTLLIAASRNESRQLAEHNAARGALLTEGFRLAQNGFAVVQKDGSVYRVLQANPAARDLLGENLLADRVAPGSWLLGIVQGSLHAVGRQTRIASDTGGAAPIEVTIMVAADATFGEIVLLSIVDLRAVRRAEEAGRVQLEREQQVVEELRNLNEQKDAFVSSVTHELRTPITTIIGFTEELADTGLDAVQRDYVAIVLRNAERLLRTIEDVLTFSKRMPRAAEPRPARSTWPRSCAPCSTTCTTACATGSCG
ncbi:MAG: histidine kinase dimerization/phospho-acceptor domain-containing protein [Microbacteriaceae bacterium]